MPGPNGFITVPGNFKKVEECELGEAAFAESVLNVEEFKQIQKDLNPSEMPASKKQIVEPAIAFKAAEETKEVELVDGDASKTATIGTGLDPK